MSSLYVMAYVRTHLKVNQRNKWVPLFVGNYEARFSTRKISDKLVIVITESCPRFLLFLLIGNNNIESYCMN